jgi:hypothetical protein
MMRKEEISIISEKSEVSDSALCSYAVYLQRRLLSSRRFSFLALHVSSGVQVVVITD